MARRPRRAPAHVELDLAKVLWSGKRVEAKFGRDWYVQPMGSQNAVKSYICPGCSKAVTPGTAHLVVWSADSIFGERAVEDRRHWHTGCWRSA